ncbi:MAG: hypothetical protein V4497_11050 [Bacteroidota bacterium]
MIEYKTREIHLFEFGNVLVSEVSLNNKLLDLNGQYISDEARFVDEQIFFFVEKKEIEYNLGKLKKLILDQVR